MSAVVHLEMHLDPTRLDEAEKVIVETLKATREWPGNQGLEVIVDDADPAHVIVVEQWENTAAHDAYAAWRLTPEGANKLGEVVTAKPVKTVFSGRIDLPY